MTPSNPSPSPIALSALPLRPSTLSTLLRSGFETTEDISSSKSCGGIANLSGELNVGVNEGAKIWREVEAAAGEALSDSLTGTGSEACDAGSRNCKSTRSNIQRESPPTVSLRRQRPRITAASLLVATGKTPGNDGGGGCGHISAAEAAAATTTQQQQQRHIVTFCRSIDSLLGGGIALSELSEVSGAPGAGKTQLCMQIAVDARLPKVFGGVEGEAIYIDSEGSFSSERCFDMAEALVRHVQRSAERRAMARGSSTTSQIWSLPTWFNPEDILAGIHVIRVHDQAAQTAAIRNLPALLRERRESGMSVKTIIVDSVAFHYRAMTIDAGRTKILTRLAASLSDLAREHDVAVVAVNQMTTKIGGGDNTSNNIVSKGKSSGNVLAYAEGNYSTSRLIPALGESWSHSVTTRIVLSQSRAGAVMKNDDSRRCHLVKCPHKAVGAANFRVTSDGIRDIAGTLRPTGAQGQQTQLDGMTSAGNNLNNESGHKNIDDNEGSFAGMKRQRTIMNNRCY